MAAKKAEYWSNGLHYILRRYPKLRVETGTQLVLTEGSELW